MGNVNDRGRRLPATMEEILDWQLAQRMTTILSWPRVKERYERARELARAEQEKQE